MLMAGTLRRGLMDKIQVTTALKNVSIDGRVRPYASVFMPPNDRDWRLVRVMDDNLWVDAVGRVQFIPGQLTIARPSPVDGERGEQWWMVYDPFGMGEVPIDKCYLQFLEDDEQV